MMHRALAAFGLALLLLPAVQAASPGARTPITVDAAVSEVDIASNGRFAAASADPEDRFTGEAEVPVWNLWNVDGSLRQSGDADLKACDTEPVTPVTEDCRTSATRIAVSGDGSRIVVASDMAGASGDDLFTIFSDAGVVLKQVSVAGIITDVAVSKDGNRFGYTADVPTQNPSERDGVAQVFDSSFQALFSPALGTPYSSPALRLAFSANGAYMTVAAGQHHYYKLTLTTDHPHSVSGASATDVDVSSTNGWSVAGFSNGFFGVYSKDIDQATPREYQKKEAAETGSVSAVAIRPDATAFVTGSSTGALRYYSLDTAATDPVTLVASKTGLGDVRDLEFSGDGRYLAVRSGADALRLYRTHSAGLDELWKDTRASLGNSVAVDQRGEHVVGHVGSSVIVYDAEHELTPILPAQTQAPGTTVNYTVSYRNDGNRMEDIKVTAAPPSGVTVSINPDSFVVVPGASKAVTVTVTLPDTRAPGTTTVPLTHKLSDGDDGTGTANLAITVTTKRDLTFEADGPASIGVQPGSQGTFRVRASNDGNVHETGALTVGGVPSGWTASADPDSLDLAPGTFAVVTVFVTPPANAAHLEAAEMVLQRSGGPSLAITATVGAGFGASIEGPRGAILNPELAQLLNFTVKNTGNAPDTLIVKLGNLPAGWQAGFLSGLNEQRIDDMEPGETAVVQATVRPPAGSASSVATQLTSTAQSLADPTKSDSHVILLTVEEPVSSSSSDDGDRGSPGVPPLLLLAALAVGALMMRRRAA